MNTRDTSRIVVVFAAVVVLVAIGVAIYSMNGQSTAIKSGATTSILSGNGLRLSLSENTVRVTNGGVIDFSIDLYNTLSEPVNVTSADLWPVANLGLSACGRTILPYGLDVFKGDYSQGNLTTARALDMFAPSGSNASSVTGPDCPNPALFSVPNYYFNPQSDLAVIDGGRTLQLNFSMAFTGYWVTNSGTSPTLHPFSSGVYTVVCGDEWGNLALVHFDVV